MVNTATLSGSLTLPGYVPVVGDTFGVVAAGEVAAHFDSVPAGMDQSETSTSASVTQVQLPPGS